MGKRWKVEPAGEDIVVTQEDVVRATGKGSSPGWDERLVATIETAMFEMRTGTPGLKIGFS